MDGSRYNVFLVEIHPEILMSARMKVLLEKDRHADSISPSKLPLTANWDISNCYNADYSISRLEATADFDTEPSRCSFVSLSLYGAHNSPDDGWISKCGSAFGILRHPKTDTELPTPGKQRRDIKGAIAAPSYKRQRTHRRNISSYRGDLWRGARRT